MRAICGYDFVFSETWAIPAIWTRNTEQCDFSIWVIGIECPSCLTRLVKVDPTIKDVSYCARHEIHKGGHNRVVRASIDFALDR
jgi:hypothetical protein